LIEAECKQIPDTNLLRARLLFDGGAFNQSLNRLLTLSVKNKNLAFISERAYRIGRSYQKLNKKDEAISWLNMAINSGGNLHEYFAASSAYQLFKRVSKFPSHPYKNSLDAKAKTAISKLNP